MNKYNADILIFLSKKHFVNQRLLAEMTGYSLGVINRSLKELMTDGYIDDTCKITPRGRRAISDSSPRSAIILAAGYGMRMIPINTETPKALLEIKGEVLIERTIRQLHEAGIRRITVVVGFMKESFEYLIDKCGVELIVNRDYSKKNNLHSLALAADKISNTYIVPADIRAENNPFRTKELYSWYMVSDLTNEESDVRVNRKNELVRTADRDGGNAMIGIAYITQSDAAPIRQRLHDLDQLPMRSNAFWEEALYSEGRMTVLARVVPSGDYFEINTYEQLRELDKDSNHLRSDAMATISDALNCSLSDIHDVEILKKGMTNHSFVFSCQGEKYIMRIPGEGTDELVNRKQEALVYRAIQGKQLCDDPVYLNPQSGYKITRYISNIRTCDPGSMADLKACMKKLRSFHAMGLTVDHSFDLYGMIDFYESLWDGSKSIYQDYEQTKQNILSLRAFVEEHRESFVLTHIDAVPDNFLFAPDIKGELSLQLTDWEYSGMQDPHVDIAMFGIYSLYDKKQIDKLISLYFDRKPCREITAKIYCYVAICGLLWSNWCEYKSKFGVEFGEYSLRQYRYAKDFYKLAAEEIKVIENECC